MKANKIVWICSLSSSAVDLDLDLKKNTAVIVR